MNFHALSSVMSKPILKNVHTNKKPTQKQKHGAPNFAPIHPICEKPEKVKIFADECQRKCVDIKSPTPKSKEWAKRAFHCEKVLCTENGIKCDANKRLIMKYDETLFASRQQNDELNARNDDEKAEMRMQLQKISSQNEQLHLQNNAKDEIIQKISAENEQLHLKVNEFGQTAGGGGEKNNQKFECVIDQQNVKVKIELDIKGVSHQWTDKRNSLHVDTVKALAQMKCNFDFSCSDFHKMLTNDKKLMNLIVSKEKYDI